MPPATPIAAVKIGASPNLEAHLQIRWPAHRSRAVLIALCLLACTLCVSTYRVFGNFWDEPEHIAAGLVLLQRGEYLYDNQHPPLARLAAAIGPYLAGTRIQGEPMPVGDDEGRDLLYNSAAGYDTVLTLARLGMLPFLLVLILATWSWTRRWYGEHAAILTTVFLVATPVLLGHAAVVAVDVPVTAMIMLSLYRLLRWFEAPSVRSGAAAGCAAGLAIGTKLSALPFIGIALLTWLVLAVPIMRRGAGVEPPAVPPPAAPARRLGSAAVGALLALAIPICLYGTHRLYLTDALHTPNRALDFWAGAHGPLHNALYRLADHTALPLGLQMVPLNILGVEWHNTHGHMSYLLGQTAPNGWWYFYPVALSVKTPLPLLLTGLAGLSLLAVRGMRSRDLYRLAPPACFVAIALFACLYSHINIGVRHVLIAFPLLAIGAGYLIADLWQARNLGVRVVLASLVAWQCATLIWSYPDYLAYFNVLAGKHPEHILVDSDLDWGGQDLRRLEKLLAQRHVTALHLGYKGTADLRREPLPPFEPLRPDQPVTGWVAITLLTLQENQAGFAWLTRFTPELVGKSFELFDIPVNQAAATP
jgi:4-amino-4-deoxy-L-arabinose transferase-like glycosyltransferase